MGTPSHLGHMDRVAATMPSQAHAGAAQEAPNIGQWEGQDVPLVRPSSCNVKGGIPSSRRYLPTYLCKSLDRLGTGTSRDFMNLSLEMITLFVNFELWANADFTARGYVLSQLIGLPMGGRISAQLAVLYLMSAEMRATRLALSVHKFIHGRYRNNFYIFGPESALFNLQQTMKVQLESTYAMPMTVEQFGTKVQVLEVIVDFDSQSRGLRLNSRALDVHTGAVSGVVRWPDRWSTSTSVWRSLVPGLCVKCGYWSWSHVDIYEKRCSYCG